MTLVFFQDLKLNNFYFVCYKPYKQMNLFFITSINEFFVDMQDIISKKKSCWVDKQKQNFMKFVKIIHIDERSTTFTSQTSQVIFVVLE